MRARARRDRRLRRTVFELSECLPALPFGQWRVLVLRAGVGQKHVRSRRAVARITGYRPRRVRTLERAGLRSLRRLLRDGRCARHPMAPSGTVMSAALVTATGGSPPTAASAGEVLSLSASSDDAAPSPGGSGSGSKSSDRGDVRPRVLSEHSQGITGSLTPRNGSGDTSSALDISLILLALLLVGLGFARELRHAGREPPRG